jgi:signal transduction histidine kinase
MRNGRLPAELSYALPGRLFQRYRRFWHTVSLGLPALALGLALWYTRTGWGWSQATLVALVSLQVAIYLRTFVLRHPWPLPWWWLTGYFVGNLSLWLLESSLDAHFSMVYGIYMGQMYALLPPRLAVPSTVCIFGMFLGFDIAWDFSRVSLGWVIRNVVWWGGWSGHGVYLYHLAQTSRERARLIAQLQEARQALERARQRDAELVVLRERERLARDLHDSLGHALVALTVQLEAVQRLYAVDPERAAAQVEAMKALTRASMAELRRSLDGLRAPGLGQRPLRPSLQALSLEIGQRTGAEVVCQVAEGMEALQPEVAEALWRVVQEALTNIEKHARARHIQVCIEQTPDAVMVRVGDDGCGLPAHAVSSPDHYGLRGMRERVEGLGGTLRLQSKDQHGTVVEARLPRIAAGQSVAS